MTEQVANNHKASEIMTTVYSPDGEKVVVNFANAQDLIRFNGYKSAAPSAATPDQTPAEEPKPAEPEAESPKVSGKPEAPVKEPKAEEPEPAAPATEVKAEESTESPAAEPKPEQKRRGRPAAKPKE